MSSLWSVDRSNPGNACFQCGADSGLELFTRWSRGIGYFTRLECQDTHGCERRADARRAAREQQRKAERAAVAIVCAACGDRLLGRQEVRIAVNGAIFHFDVDDCRRVLTAAQAISVEAAA